MPSVDVNGMTLEYDIRGSGEPMLWIMGLGGQLTAWPDEFVDLFVAQGYQVIRFDNRDIGLSTHTDFEAPSQAKVGRSFLTRRPLKWDGYTLSDMADDAAGLLDALNISAAHVMGISMGGMISQELTIRHPEKVLSLCSIMSNPGDRKSGGMTLSLLVKFARQPEPTRENAEDLAIETFRSFSGPHFNEAEYRLVAAAAVERSFYPLGVPRQTAAIAASRDRTPLLASIKVPTLAIHGLIDPLVKHSGGEATTKAIPGARLLSLPDMGHDLPRPRWDEMCAAIIANIHRATQPTASR